MSGETNSEKSRRVQDQHPGQGSLSGESDVDEKVPDEKQDLEMTDWDRYLSQVMAAYNSTQHSTTGVSPHMMLTGHKKSLPLTFFYPEYEGKKTSPQVYVRDVIRRQQELNDLCRRNTQQVKYSKASGHRSGSERDADKNLGKNGLHEGIPVSDKSTTTAANRGSIYVAGRTPITVLHMGGRDLWMSFLVVENLDDSDRFILGRDFIKNFDVMIDLNNGSIRMRNPAQKYVKKPVNMIIIDENKVPIFLDRKVILQPGQQFLE